MSKTKAFLWVLALVFIGIITACDTKVDVDDSDPLAERLRVELENGKTALSAGRYEDAKTYFNNILLEIDENNSEALFGWNISVILKTVNDLVNSLVSLIGLLVETGVLERGADQNLADLIDSPAFGKMQKSGIGSMVEAALSPFERQTTIINENYDKIIANQDNFVFRIDSLPVDLGPFKNLINLGGEFDIGEVYAFSSIMKIILVAFHFVNSIDYSINLLQLAGELMTIFGAVEKWDADKVIGLICYVLDESPRLLLVNRDDGAVRLNSAGILLAGAADNIVKLVEHLKLESEVDPNQDDDIIKYSIVDFGGTVEESIVISLDLGANPFIDTTQGDNSLIIPLSESIETGFGHIRDNIGGQDIMISWAEDLAPLLSLTVISILRLGFVQALIESVFLDSGGSDIIDTILNPTILNEGVLTGLITEIIPDQFKFDLDPFFNNPIGLRDYLPARTTDLGDVTPLGKLANKFIFEYECTPSDLYSADALVSGFICPVDTALVDGPHFPGYDLSRLNEASPEATRLYSAYVTDLAAFNVSDIPADGIDSMLPYIPFNSPSFGSVLYIRLDESDDFELSDHYSINAIIADIAGNLVELIGSMM